MIGWCIHNWTKWSEPEQSVVKNYLSFVQHRTCKWCGLHETRTVE